jgi:hypothetical protein
LNSALRANPAKLLPETSSNLSGFVMEALADSGDTGQCPTCKKKEKAEISLSVTQCQSSPYTYFAHPSKVEIV